MVEREDRVLKLNVLETIAANLGSMLTPIGNPQNLYLYGKSQLSFSAFLQLMLPYTLLSAILLSVCIFYLGHPHRRQTAESRSCPAWKSV